MTATVAFLDKPIADEIEPVFWRYPLVKEVARLMDRAILPDGGSRQPDGGSRRYGSAEMVDLMMQAIKEVESTPEHEARSRPSAMDLQLFVSLVLDCTDALTSLTSNERRRYQDQVTNGLQAEIIAHAA